MSPQRKNGQNSVSGINVLMCCEPSVTTCDGPLTCLIAAFTKLWLGQPTLNHSFSSFTAVHLLSVYDHVFCLKEAL